MRSILRHANMMYTTHLSPLYMHWRPNSAETVHPPTLTSGPERTGSQRDPTGWVSYGKLRKHIILLSIHSPSAIQQGPGKEKSAVGGCEMRGDEMVHVPNRGQGPCIHRSEPNTADFVHVPQNNARRAAGMPTLPVWLVSPPIQVVGMISHRGCGWQGCVCVVCRSARKAHTSYRIHGRIRPWHRSLPGHTG